jgi:hypothetical protein
MTETGDRSTDRVRGTGPVRLVLDHAAGHSLDRGDVSRPDRLLVGRAQPPGRQEGADLGRELGLHEEVLEGRMGDVGGVRGQDDLGIRGELDLAVVGTEVGE